MNANSVNQLCNVRESFGSPKAASTVNDRGVNVSFLRGVPGREVTLPTLIIYLIFLSHDPASLLIAVCRRGNSCSTSLINRVEIDAC